MVTQFRSFWNQTAWAQILPPTTTNCVATGNPLNSPVPVFSSEDVDDSTDLAGPLGLNEL